jgi:membrane protein
MPGFAWRRFWTVLSGALFEWYEDKVPRMAAALAFYTIFSLTPIVFISLAIAGELFGRQRATDELLQQVGFLIGREGVSAIRLLMENHPENPRTLPATIAGLATMFFASTAAFAELKDALNTIWEIRPKPGLGLVEMLRDRVLSFAMVLVIGFFLVVSLVISTLLSMLSQQFAPSLRVVEMGISFMVITLLISLVYKYLPYATVPWRAVWFGAAVFAVLFAFGKTAFGIYLGQTAIASGYGAAGSLVIVLLWVYYSSCILLFGAEMTQVQSRVEGDRVEPTGSAVHLTEHERIQQGIPHEVEFQESLKDAEAADQDKG